MSGFDAAHPLWEFTLVEDLSGGRSHGDEAAPFPHRRDSGECRLLWPLRHRLRTPTQGRLPEPPNEPARGTAELVCASIGHGGRRVLGLTRHQAARRSCPRCGEAVDTPCAALETAVEMMASSVGRTVAPVSSTLSPLMTRSQPRATPRHARGRARRPEAGIGVGGGSVNDGFMAAVTGGSGDTTSTTASRSTNCRVTLPISVRTPEDPAAGNRITLARFTVPVGLVDPVARIKAIGRALPGRSQRAVGPPMPTPSPGCSNLLPPGAVGSMLKHVDFLASNVPGIDFPVYLAGARMTGYVPFSPTIGAAVNVTLLSYNGTCEVGVTVDTAAVPDIEVFMACLVRDCRHAMNTSMSGTAAVSTVTPGAAVRQRG